MLEYFTEYTWNLSLSMALDMGANMDEIDRACRKLRDEGTPLGADPSDAFFHAWVSAAEKLERSAQEDAQSGNHLTASEKFRRATVMYITAERMPMHTHPARHAAYERLLTCFSRYVELGRLNCERVSVPYGNSALPALLVRARGASPTPCVVHFNGLDGIKEFLFLSGFPEALARRGVSTLIVDNPGVGEALRKHGLHNGAEAEVPASACVDYLEGLDEVDLARIGMVALSMGGYHAPRATAFESRFKCCVAWGANFDWGVRFRKRLAGTGTQKSVPHLFDHVKWVLGADSVEECARIADDFSLRGILDRIRVPILITHGEHDRQIPVEDAYATYEACVNSPLRNLRVFTADEGAEQHCGIGNMSLTTDYMADWIGKVLTHRD